VILKRKGKDLKLTNFVASAHLGTWLWNHQNHALYLWSIPKGVWNCQSACKNAKDKANQEKINIGTCATHKKNIIYKKHNPKH
jgi:predicted NUDIX family NTP pyrophosphohydrolase